MTGFSFTSHGHLSDPAFRLILMAIHQLLIPSPPFPPLPSIFTITRKTLTLVTSHINPSNTGINRCPHMHPQNCQPLQRHQIPRLLLIPRPPPPFQPPHEDCP